MKTNKTVLNVYFSVCVALVLTTFIGCSNQDESDSFLENADVKAERSDFDLALDLVEEFGQTHFSDPATKTESNGKMKIIDYNVQSLDVDMDLKDIPVSKSVDPSSEASKLDIYTVNFERNGKRGYSIVVPDKRINKVYAYVEDGNLSDTTYILGLNAFISYIPAHSLKDLKEYYNEEPQMKAIC